MRRTETESNGDGRYEGMESPREPGDADCMGSDEEQEDENAQMKAALGEYAFAHSVVSKLSLVQSTRLQIQFPRLSGAGCYGLLLWVLSLVF